MKKLLVLFVVVAFALVGCGYTAKQTMSPVGDCPKMPEPMKVVEKAPVIPPVIEKAPVVVPVPEIIPYYFDFDKSNLVNQEKAIDRTLAILNADKSKSAELQGNCDNRGTDAYNMKLGDRRAKTVKKILVKKGIDEKRLSTKSFGESKATGNHKKDRRVDIVVK